jgi:hypothetical protein
VKLHFLVGLRCQAMNLTSINMIAALVRARIKKAAMEKRKQFLDPSNRHILPSPACSKTRSDPRVHVEDKRVARLLLVLHELDQSVAGLEQLPQSELSELISSAILACGFADGTEARYAIAAVLEAIERHDPMLEGS